MVMHKNIEVRSSVIAGHGMYVIAPIAAGEVLWHEEEDESKYLVHEDVVKTWPADVQKKFYNFAYQVGDGVWSGAKVYAKRRGVRSFTASGVSLCSHPGVPEGVESDGSEYMNHSCDPSCVLVREGRAMITTRALDIGGERFRAGIALWRSAGASARLGLTVMARCADELTYDYATSEAIIPEHYEAFDCQCGTPVCRGTPLPDDWRKPSIQARYAGHFTAYVQSLIDAALATPTPSPDDSDASMPRLEATE